ncbi:hypothetical protein FGG08_000262 [Glutinoglossum americanum]|uniref:3-hydroxyisobutyryl-CoA hydrolase n=1 Tax=Glutinoglossum americanum TaxID=1670608 RepID=A0A9P8IDM8_9PEZI|nr:hypothetical protein FGG08_000262 [Glutinoglossum americanum]
MSTEPEIPRELPGDEPDDVLFGTIYGVRTVELNRPKKLNSLNASMARKIIPRLKEWEKSQLANVIIIKGAGPKAFCAGGDVAELAENNTESPSGTQKSKGYFALEYNLDHTVATYSKPYVAFMDGITMGGGVGLSVHAPFRIATERTVFAMPETTIGFFPDVGGSFFLPRLDGEIGTYLGLTSERLKGVNTLFAGIATHYLHSSSLPDLEARLSELVFKDYASLQERFRIIDNTIEEFVTGLPDDEPLTLVGETREAVDRCFCHDTIEDILSALAKEGTPWAERTIQALHERSPTSVRVTLRQMRLGRRWSIAEAFQREYHIAGKLMDHPDFTEGVFARLIRKPAETPKWQPASLESTNDVDTEAFFKVEGEQKLQLINSNSEVGDYHEYPHRWLVLPREQEIEYVVREGQKTADEVIEHFVETRRGKAGVREKVSEVLARKTRAAKDHGGKLAWISSS